MKSFFDMGTDRVKVVSGPLKGRKGTVVRRCITMDAAWVKIDGGLPEKLRVFTATDDRRRDHIRLEPGACEPLQR